VVSDILYNIYMTILYMTVLCVCVCVCVCARARARTNNPSFLLNNNKKYFLFPAWISFST